VRLCPDSGAQFVQRPELTTAQQPHTVVPQLSGLSTGHTSRTQDNEMESARLLPFAVPFRIGVAAIVSRVGPAAMKCLESSARQPTPMFLTANPFAG
jgi:hypothetical protein